MDHEVGVGCCVDENNVGGGSKHCKHSAGKSRESGSKSNGIECTFTCCLELKSAHEPT